MSPRVRGSQQPAMLFSHRKLSLWSKLCTNSESSMFSCDATAEYRRCFMHTRLSHECVVVVLYFFFSIFQIPVFSFWKLLAPSTFVACSNFLCKLFSRSTSSLVSNSPSLSSCSRAPSYSVLHSSFFFLFFLFLLSFCSATRPPLSPYADFYRRVRPPHDYPLFSL